MLSLSWRKLTHINIQQNKNKINQTKIKGKCGYYYLILIKYLSGKRQKATFI